MGMGFASTWLRRVSPLLHKTTLTTAFTSSGQETERVYSYNPVARSPHGATLNNLLTLVYTETDDAWLLVRKQQLSYWQKNHDSYIIQASVLSNCRIESNRIEKSIRQRESNRIESNFFSANRNALIITLLIRVAFVYNGPKGMELAPNPRYSGGS